MLKFSHILKFFIIGITFLFFSNCTTKNDISLGLLLPVEEGSRWMVDKRYIVKAADELGVEVKSRSANYDENLQVKQAKELCEEGVDALLVVSVNSNNSAEIVRIAKTYDIPVIAYDRLIRNSNLPYYVSFDYNKTGELMVNYALNQKPSGNFIFLWGDPSDFNAIKLKEIHEELTKDLERENSINVIFKSFVNEYSTVEAEILMQKVLDYSDTKIDVIIAGNDYIALTAIETLKKEGKFRNDIVVIGQDCEFEAVQSILRSEMKMSVYKSLKSLARTSVNLAVDLVKKNKIEGINASTFNGRVEVPTILLEPQIVDINAIEPVLVGDGFYSKEDLY